MTTWEALKKYVGKKSPQPHLVVQEPELAPDQMKSLGFEKKDEYWVISLKDAKETVESLEAGSIDYDKHWEWEKDRWTIPRDTRV